MDLTQAFANGQGTWERVDKMITLVERMDKIDRVIDRIKYNDELVTEIPEALKMLGDAKDAIIAEMKMV